MAWGYLAPEPVPDVNMSEDIAIIETDVLIVGGGPAGLSAALSLLNTPGTDVVLVEQSELDHPRIGEHVSGSIFKFTEFLKLGAADFEPGCFSPTYGNISYWGSDQPISRESIFTPAGPGYQLDREKFDTALMRKVAERGGVVFPRTRCLEFQQDDSHHWEVVARHATRGSMMIKARFLVDATGRQAHVCRQIGVLRGKIDSLMGVGAFLRPSRIEMRDQLLETAPLGWWYSSVLPDDSVAVIFFSDADMISKNKLNTDRGWIDLLNQTRHIKYRLGELKGGSPVWVRNAFSQISDATGFQNFLAIGDAAVAFDPISSMGIGFALSSGCQAAVMISNELAGVAFLGTSVYQRDLSQNFSNYLSRRKTYYSQEKRWGDSDFWRRRR